MTYNVSMGTLDPTRLVDDKDQSEVSEGVVTEADQNTFQDEVLLVGDEVGDELVVAEYLDVDPDERGQQEHAEEQHQRRAASRVVVLPHRRRVHDEEQIEQDDRHAAAQPDRHELVQLHASVQRHTVIIII